MDGSIGIPSQSAYNAAKFAVRGFTEALRIELDLEDCGVTATAIHPGGIRTNIARNARIDESVMDIGQDPQDAKQSFENLFITSPKRAAKVIVRAIEKDKRRAMVGPDAHLINLAAKLPPNLYQRVVGWGATRGS